MFRNDDEQYESMFYGNILIGLSSGSYSGAMLKHVNTFENNMILNWSSHAVGGKNLDSTHEDPDKLSVVSRNIFMHPGTNSIFYKEIDLFSGDGNVFHAAQNKAGAAEWLKNRQTVGWDANSSTDDPMFEDLEHFNFRLEAGSPALQRGFKQIPFESIGLLCKPAVNRLRESGITFSQLLDGE